MNPLTEIAHVADVPVELTVQLDRKVMTVGQILDLQEGSVIKMSRSAGENIDILVAGSLISCGEIVIIENTMGVRITDFQSDE